MASHLDGLAILLEPTRPGQMHIVKSLEVEGLDGSNGGLSLDLRPGFCFSSSLTCSKSKGARPLDLRGLLRLLLR